jgi:saccharopine dehydrogenase-like NADP-dependent oxidoreductase
MLANQQRLKADRACVKHKDTVGRQKVRVRVVCKAEGGNTDTKNVVILGGTGRVGSATAASLIDNFKHYNITVASRNVQSFEKICELRPSLKNAVFKQVDIADPSSIKVRLPLFMHNGVGSSVNTEATPCAGEQAAISGADLVLHTAGPFQHSKNFNVIEAAIETKTPYIDVCDDTTYSERYEQAGSCSSSSP